MHTRLIDEVDEWKIQRSLELVREMGAGTIVEFFPWAYIEGSEDQYDWSSADRIVRHARNQGMHIIARLGLVPEWARKKGDAQRRIHDAQHAAGSRLSRLRPVRRGFRRALRRGDRRPDHLERAEPRLRVGLPDGRSGGLRAAAASGLRARARRQPQRA